MKSEQIGNLIELVTKNSLNLPQVAKRGVMSTVVQAGTALQNSSNEKLYWSQTIQPLYDQFKQIISRNDFSRSCHQEDVKIQITELFEFFIGSLFIIYIKYCLQYVQLYINKRICKLKFF